MLTLCPRCSQFHRPSESACPFCGARRAVTAAILGAAVALTGAACTPEKLADGGASKPLIDVPRPRDIVPVPPYGVPPMPEPAPTPGEPRPPPEPEPTPLPDAGAEVQPPPVLKQPRPVPVPAYGISPMPPRPDKPKKP